MGSAYLKQGDVVIASWATGLELLISTKTMLSSYAKNLRNRFEEGYGDAKNLRGRHPLSALGFLFIAGNDISDQDLAFAIDMLRKLKSEPDVYDCCCLLLFEDSLSSTVPAGTPVSESGRSSASAGGIAVVKKRTPEDLSADEFFRRLVEKALAQMPVDVYSEVRERRAQASQ